MAEKKEKQYVSDIAQLMAEWDWEKNNELGFNPNTLTFGSNKKVWWKCKNDHQWQATIANRNNGRSCPYCAGKIVLTGYNDLQTVNPILAQEWNYEKNDGFTPANVSANSHIKAWWKCGKGHEWRATIKNRNMRNGCPYCSGRAVLMGYNDLQTLNPALAQEWNYEKNSGLTPTDVLPSSNKKVWWTCSKGHEWQAVIGNRNKGVGCPICSSERKTSFPEYAIEYYLTKYGLDVVHSYNEHGYELDVYIPSKTTAIEYDGYFWHKSKEKKDLEKNLKCKKDGIRLYRIREGLPPLNDSSIDYIVQRGHRNLSEILQIVLSKIIKTYVDVNLERDTISIENLRKHSEKKNSLLLSNPVLAKEWNYEKNGILTPEYVTANSRKKAWWKCDKGHEWQATIDSRSNGRRCPYCSGNKVLAGYNDLQTVNPTLAKEWNYEKNNGLTPMDIMPNSGKKVWWKCKKGHEWQATIDNRNKGKKCPYCTGRYAINGENDLQTVNPALAKEWNHEKNNGLVPTDVLPNSSKKVWWKCSKGHEWQAIIQSRNIGSGCPYCAGRKKQ